MNTRFTMVVLGATLSACAPSARDLVARRHFREAICAAHDDRDPAVRRAVSDAVVRDMGLTVHAQLVRAPLIAELQQARARHSTVAMLRFDLQSDALPIDETTVRASFGSERSRFGSSEPRRGGGVRSATIDALAAVTREPLPRARQGSTYLTFDNLLRGAAAVLTGGISLAFQPMQMQPATYTIAPSDAEIRRAAPRASDLALHVHSTGCTRLSPGGTRCRWYAIIEEVPDAELVVRLEVTHRASAPRRRDEACYLQTERRMSLGRVGDLERTLPERFGTRAIAIERVGPSRVIVY